MLNSLFSSLIYLNRKFQKVLLVSSISHKTNENISLISTKLGNFFHWFYGKLETPKVPSEILYLKNNLFSNFLKCCSTAFFVLKKWWNIYHEIKISLSLKKRMLFFRKNFPTLCTKYAFKDVIYFLTFDPNMTMHSMHTES